MSKERPSIGEKFRRNLRDKATAAVIPLAILLPTSIEANQQAQEKPQYGSFAGSVRSGFENVITTFAPKAPEVKMPVNEIISFHQKPSNQEIQVFSGSEMVPAAAVVESIAERKHLPNVPLWRQADRRWGGMWYGTASMADSGCGPTSLAMVISYYKGRYIYPPETAKQALKHHWRIPHVGTSSRAMTEMPKLYGLDSKQVSWADAKEALHHGKPIIQAQGKGYFTSEGHYIVITKAKGNTYYINDSGPRHRTRATERQIKASMQGSWLISEKKGH